MHHPTHANPPRYTSSTTAPPPRSCGRVPQTRTRLVRANRHTQTFSTTLWDDTLYESRCFYAGLRGMTRGNVGEVQHQWGFEGVVWVGAGKTDRRFCPSSVSRREGRFWGERMWSSRPSATGLWWVKCGKSRGYGEFGREAEVGTEFEKWDV